MEFMVVVYLFIESLNFNVKLFVYVGDEDFIIVVYIKEKVFYFVEKWIDIVYVKRFFIIRLYNLS